MARSVPLLGRLLDAVGLVVFLAGAGTYGWAWVQLRRLQDVQPSSPGLEFAALARADRLTAVSRTGLVLMGVGAVLAVAAAVVASRMGKEQP